MHWHLRRRGRRVRRRLRRRGLRGLRHRARRRARRGLRHRPECGRGRWSRSRLVDNAIVSDVAEVELAPDAALARAPGTATPDSALDSALLLDVASFEEAVRRGQGQREEGGRDLAHGCLCLRRSEMIRASRKARGTRVCVAARRRFAATAPRGQIRASAGLKRRARPPVVFLGRDYT